MLICEQVINPPAPAALFQVLVKAPYPVWLDANVDAAGLGRYSLLAADPFLLVSSLDGQIEVEDCLKKQRSSSHETFFPFLERLRQSYQRPKEDTRFPCEGGLLGYLGYELGHQIEDFNWSTVNDLKMPDAWFGAYDALIVIDHLKDETWLLANGLPETSPDEAERRARRRLTWLGEVVAESRQNLNQNLSSSPKPDSRQLSSNFSHADYHQAIKRILEYIAAGDIYQVNLSQRFTVPFSGSAADFYLRFREVSPAPFGAFLNTGRHFIMSNSPERYLLIKGDYIETRPIKGTRPRGQTPTADEKLHRELLSSPKDRAEHIMIVDLERNDLGRIAAYGSVHVPEMQIIESYANVHHMVSTVAARVAPGQTSVDCLVNSFPGGSITGAPKLRSMEIIDELEPSCRGVYTGSIGYLDFSGDLDFNIAIRTAIACDDQLYFQVGGGIVADSDPEEEYLETQTKAASFIKALG